MDCHTDCAKAAQVRDASGQEKINKQNKSVPFASTCVSNSFLWMRKNTRLSLSK